MKALYFMPGMAANSSIFEHLKFSEEKYTVHLLEWQLPESSQESISDYAKRMTLHITHDNPILIGVSFGGILVQEMAKHIQVEKLIIISSIKTKQEMPRRFKLSRKLKLYKVLPTHLFEDVDKLAKYAFGETVKNRVSLYQRYLSMNDRRYLNWAIREMVCWNQTAAPDGIIHIHGDADRVFPSQYIKEHTTIKGGTHIMILTKFKWFNENLPRLIENN